MSVSGNGRAPSHFLDVPPHRFSVGQIVKLTNRIGVWPKTEEIYRVTGTLPARDDALQYRIRCDNERYERVATEDNLELVRAPQNADSAAVRSWTSRSSKEGSATVAVGRKRGDR